MNFVLVCMGNIQEYILDNIRQLTRLNHDNIWVLTNTVFFDNFSQYKDNIKLISIESLQDSFHYDEKNHLDKQFRNGFWTFTSQRFFYIYEFMCSHDITNVIHLENDVLIYYNCTQIRDSFDPSYIYIPFDTYTRNIASIVYIPSANVLKPVLERYDFHKNDMENFSHIMRSTGLIQPLPIFIDSNINIVYRFITTNYDRFHGFIFDAAAMGQYLGGVDPRNISGDTVGFVNETCIIKYNQYSFVWDTINDIKRPFIIVDGNKIPIFNLHVHSKNLVRLM
jgi:hypothetical protein